MKDISKKRVSKVLVESHENDYFNKFKNLCSVLNLDTDSFDTDLAIFKDGSGFEYEDQGGHLEVTLDESGHWYWEDSDFGETTSEGDFETEHEEGDGGWNALIDSLFSSDLSIFVATPYTSEDFKEKDDLQENNKKRTKNRMKEEREYSRHHYVDISKAKDLHTYEFLICNGDAASSHGEDVDGFYVKKVSATSLRKALILIWSDLTYFGSFRAFSEYYLDEEGEDPRTWSGDELLEYLESLDVSGGEHWIAAYKVDGKLVKEPKAIDAMLETYVGDNVRDAVYFSDSVDPTEWGINFKESKKSSQQRVKESTEKTFGDLYKDQSSPYYYMSDDTVELLTSIESDTGLGPEDIIEILTNMVEGKYSFAKYQRRDYRDNYKPYMGEDAAYNLFCIKAITKEQFIEITKHYKQEGIKIG